jgi:hypothetical protein
LITHLLKNSVYSSEINVNENSEEKCE